MLCLLRNHTPQCGSQPSERPRDLGTVQVSPPLGEVHSAATEQAAGYKRISIKQGFQVWQVLVHLNLIMSVTQPLETERTKYFVLLRDSALHFGRSSSIRRFCVHE